MRDIENVPFTLQNVVDDAATILELKVEEKKKLEPHHDMHPDISPKTHWGFEKGWRQYTHLGNNAVKFTQKGEIVPCAFCFQTKL